MITSSASLHALCRRPACFFIVYSITLRMPRQQQQTSYQWVGVTSGDLCFVFTQSFRNIISFHG